MNRLLLSAAMLIAVVAAADEPSLNSVPRTIDVIATDNRGAHLAGLTQSDFQILEDGKSREIARFTALTRGADGWTIVSSGRLGAPPDIVWRRVQVRYTAEWKPLELTVDATVRGQAQTVHTTVQGTTATSEIVTVGQTTKPDVAAMPVA